MNLSCKVLLIKWPVSAQTVLRVSQRQSVEKKGNEVCITVFQLCLLNTFCMVDKTNSTSFGSAKKPFHTDLLWPLENIVHIRSCSKIYDSEQF